MRLSLIRTKDGKPQRFSLRCGYEDKDIAKAVGFGTARWQAKSKIWTYPLEPAVVRSLYETVGSSVVLDEAMEDYLEELYARQQEIIYATQRREPTGKPLWPFQVGSVYFLETAGRAILGHQMGMGKTPTSCAALDYINASRVLIVCPNSVKWSWVDHLTEWCDERSIYLLDSDKKKTLDDRAEVIQGDSYDRDDKLSCLLANQNEFTLITSYDLMRIHQKAFLNYEYDCIISDEAHRLTNRKAQRTEVMEKLVEKSPYVWLLTGTPVRNNYDDLFTLLSICDPLRFNSYWNFVNIHLGSVPNIFGGVHITGLRDPDSFNAMLSTYMFRVTKKEAMPDLPDKLYSTIRLKMKPRQETIYAKMEQDFIILVEKLLENGEKLESVLTAPNVVAQIMRLRQICLTPALLGSKGPSAKMEALSEIIDDLQDQAIIYSCFRQFIVFIEKTLQHQGIPYATIVGGQSSKERDDAVKALNDGKVRVILGTVQAMGEGLNLQSATTAIFTDIDWVPAVNEQAEDRIHRGTIKESPTIVRLYHPGTVESDIMGVNSRKEKIVGETTGQVEAIREMLLRSRRR